MDVAPAAGCDAERWGDGKALTASQQDLIDHKEHCSADPVKLATRGYADVRFAPRPILKDRTVSNRGVAAVDQEIGAGHELRLVAGEVHRARGDLVRRAETADKRVVGGARGVQRVEVA